jgi:hypothetical protein
VLEGVEEEIGEEEGEIVVGDGDVDGGGDIRRWFRRG